MAPVVTGLMFYWMFPSEFGLVNQILAALGLPSVLWFNRPWTAFAVIVLADVWTWTPWFVLIIYAGLQSLTPEPFEAAHIDGAGVCYDPAILRWRSRPAREQHQAGRDRGYPVYDLRTVSVTLTV